MREGILEQLPTTLPKDKVVMVVGPEDFHGLNYLKSQIQEMNRGEKWIKAEFRTEVSDSQVSDKVAVLLTMYAMKHGTLANMRKAATALKICCPNQALTVSEVKEILPILDNLRKGLGRPLPQNGARNENGDHPMPGKSEAQRLEEISAGARRQTEEFLLATKQNTGTQESVEQETSVSCLPVQNSDDVDAALSAIEKFGGIFEETQLAVLVVADQLKATAAECSDLRTQLTEKDEKIAELSTLITNANKIALGCGALEDENKKLKGEIVRLQKTLSSLGDLIKGAQSK